MAVETTRTLFQLMRRTATARFVYEYNTIYAMLSRVSLSYECRSKSTERL